MGPMGDSAYAESGVDTSRADSAVAALVQVLRTIDPGRPSRAALGSGHYANVLEVGENLGIALSTDGVGSKVIVAEQLGRFDTVGIDCIAMNVNDVICVGAEPLAVLDYIAVEDADPERLHQIALGLKEGAEQAGVEIPGGELAQLPELIRGHPSPSGFDLVGACLGTVALDAIVTGAGVQPGDAVIGLPSSGVHSNGYTLARRALPDLLPTPDVEVRGLAHITSGGMLNLLRLEADVGYRIDRPLPVPPIFDLIADAAGASPEEMYEVFNMGCGFCCVVPQDHADLAGELLAGRHRGARPIGVVTDRAGVVELPAAGLAGGEE